MEGLAAKYRLRRQRHPQAIFKMVLRILMSITKGGTTGLGKEVEVVQKSGSTTRFDKMGGLKFVTLVSCLDGQPS
jgi:hypothetical protein